MKSIGDKSLLESTKDYLPAQPRQVFNEHVEDCKFYTVGEKTTICMLTCRNGYEIIGQSQCINPDEYTAEIGARYALQDAVEELVSIWAYEQHWTNDNIDPDYAKSLEEE